MPLNRFNIKLLICMKIEKRKHDKNINVKLPPMLGGQISGGNSIKTPDIMPYHNSNDQKSMQYLCLISLSKYPT
jgi:hypothetical protein